MQTSAHRNDKKWKRLKLSNYKYGNWPLNISSQGTNLKTMPGAVKPN